MRASLKMAVHCVIVHFVGTRGVREVLASAEDVGERAVKTVGEDGLLEKLSLALVLEAGRGMG